MSLRENEAVQNCQLYNHHFSIGTTKTLKIVVVVVGDSDGKALVTSEKTIGIKILNSILII